MHTNSITHAISVDAPPSAVFGVLADPRALPSWAPGFARSVRPDGADWVVDTGAGEVRRHVPVSREHGTVDFLAAPGAREGFFTRVVANGDGSQVTFTLVAAEAEQQRDMLTGELETLKRLCEHPAG